MCGIFSILNSNERNINEKINNAFKLGKKRGPESSKIIYSYMNCILGFHRLAINGLNVRSNQPIFVNNCYLICNGEIYNYKKLYKILGITPNTDSDCEVIIHMYKKYGIEQCLQMLDGVFSFVLVEYNIDKSQQESYFNIFIARDPYGIRSLYEGIIDCSEKSKQKNNKYIYASEMKCIIPLKENEENMTITQFEPGTYTKFIYSNDINEKWVKKVKNKRYNYFPCINHALNISKEHEIQNMIYNSLTEAVLKRIDNTERPIACLLSGGLDSSLITAIVKKHWKGEYPLETYAIGLEGSEDLRNAQIVADFLGTKHTSLVVSEDSFFEAIPNVIYNIESYDTTTVRASVGNYLISKYISENSDAKVIFNGDGSDEVTGGYMYFHNCPDEIEFDKECKRLLKDIYTFDVLRSDKSISSNGLEARTPFLDKGFIQTYLSIPAKFRFHVEKDQIEKYLLRESFDRENILPQEVLWRRKEAFSDGVSQQNRSWYQIIQEKLEKPDIISEEFSNRMNDIKHIKPKTREQMYYRYIFEKFFTSNYCNVLPYYWMPNYTNIEECSARALLVYNKKKNDTLLNNMDFNKALEYKNIINKKIQEINDEKINMINEFDKKINNEKKEIAKINSVLFNKCEHKWIHGSDGGIDECPEKICEKCNIII